MYAAAALLAVAIAATPAHAQTVPQPQPAPGTPFGPVTPAAPPETPETEPTDVGRPQEEGLQGIQIILMLGIAIGLIGGVIVMIVRDGRVRREAKKQRRKGSRATGRPSGATGARPAQGRPKGGPPPPPRKKSAKAKAKAKRR